jgi:hypothetical protein
MAKPSAEPSSDAAPPENANAVLFNPNSDPNLDAKRSRRQFALFLGGSAFALFATLITKRAVNRRLRWSKPTFYRNNMQHPEQQINGGLEALEAFSVATVNVVSWGLMFVGGMFYAFDISSLEEMRARNRTRMGLTSEDQKGSQVVVGEWIEAAKPWKLWKKPAETGNDGAAIDHAINQSCDATTTSPEDRSGS